MKRLVCVIAIGCLMLCLTECGTPASTKPEKEYSMETMREEVYGVDSLVKLADGTEVTAICFDKLSRVFDGRNPAFEYQFYLYLNYSLILHNFYCFQCFF